MATEPQHSETMLAASSSSEPGPAPQATSEPAADVSADAALIVAALDRMQAAVRDERDMVGRLRSSLGEMAQAIARAKAQADTGIAGLLDEFEHRVDAMLEMAGGWPEPAAAVPSDVATTPSANEAARTQDTQGEDAPAAQAEITETLAAPTAASDQVPTVSSVVLLLGSSRPPSDSAPDPAVAEASQSDESAGNQGPTVAMLTAMVEALSASIPAPEPEPQAAAEFTPPVPEPQPAAEFAPPVLELEPVAEAAPPAPEPVAIAEFAPPAPPPVTTVQETELLASFEQMGVRPIPPPDEGTAVIFTPRPEPQSQPQSELPPEPPAPSTATDVLDATPAAEIPPAAKDATLTPPPDAASAAVSEEAEFDPTDFLFGPEPEPDPAAFLLDPAPEPPPAPPQQAAVLPHPEFVATPPESPPAKNPDPEPESKAPQPAPTAEAAQPEPEPARHDPLRALKAMSANERLAIFS
jgi:hypothetical protein